MTALRSVALLALAFAAPLAAQTTLPEGEPALARSDGRLDRKVDPDAYSVISAARGLSTHKATFVYPATWAQDYEGRNAELIFQFSAKQKLFGSNLFLAYTQKSFWQWLDSGESSPFRETNYDPEIFYRWIPPEKEFNKWGADFGFEHESNGRSVPESRSWNRVYVAPFQAKGKHLAYLKFWYRVPEKDKSAPLDPKGDDNPDITEYMGNAELSYSLQIGGGQLLTGMGRGNPDTGRGAVQLTWSIPSKDGWAFLGASVFHGYGESLALYDTEITRVMLGVLLAR